MSYQEYYKTLEDMKERQFNFMIGGRNVGKNIFYAEYICKWLSYYLGGTVVYKPFDVYLEICVYNDDIGYMKYTLYYDTLKYEKGYVIFTRMLEEYDAHMRYKYRDYKESEVTNE
jgi:hypothetical protein